MAKQFDKVILRNENMFSPEVTFAQATPGRTASSL
jgi:hypothetical protein